MPVRAPRTTIARGLFCRRGAPERLRPRPARIAAPKPMTNAMLDILLCVLFFLIVRFESSGECGCITPWPNVPAARNTADLVDAPLVTVAGAQILVDGSSAGGGDALLASRRMQRVDDLFTTLRTKREIWKQLHPRGAFPGIVALAIDEGTPAFVVKSVVQTSALAGYPSIHLVTRRD